MIDIDSFCHSTWMSPLPISVMMFPGIVLTFSVGFRRDIWVHHGVGSFAAWSSVIIVSTYCLSGDGKVSTFSMCESQLANSIPKYIERTHNFIRIYWLPQFVETWLQCSCLTLLDSCDTISSNLSRVVTVVHQNNSWRYKHLVVDQIRWFDYFRLLLNY